MRTALAILPAWLVAFAALPYSPILAVHLFVAFLWLRCYLAGSGDKAKKEEGNEP